MRGTFISPLIYLAKNPSTPYMAEKVRILIEGGLSAKCQDLDRRTTLQVLLKTSTIRITFGNKSKWEDRLGLGKEALKALIILLVDGTDIGVYNKFSRDATQLAVDIGIEVLWREILQFCALNADEVIGYQFKLGKREIELSRIAKVLLRNQYCSWARLWESGSRERWKKKLSACHKHCSDQGKNCWYCVNLVRFL